MFGQPFRIEYGGLGVSLVPYEKEWMADLAKGMTSLEVCLYTLQTQAFTYEDELEWFDRKRKDEGSYTWAIVPDGCEKAVGMTNLHHFQDVTNACSSSIIIYDRNWWGKGVASRAHLIRTWFAADIKNRFSMTTQVMEPNDGSRKALEKVGYFVTGKDWASAYRDGKFINLLNLSWLNPDRITLLYPDGIEELPDFVKSGIERARVSLDKARSLVKKI